MIYVLLMTLVVLLLISYWSNRGDIISPSFIFCCSFLFASVWAAVYANKWDLVLYKNTYLVITLGVLEFIITCKLVHSCFNVFAGNKAYWVRTELRTISIQKGKYILFALFQVFTILITSTYLLRAVGSSSLSAAIFLYRYGDTSARVSMPGYLNIMRTCVNASAYWFAYVFSNNLVVNKKVDKNALLVIVLAVLNTVIVGSRGNVVYVALAIIVIYIILNNKNRDYAERKLRFRYLLAAVTVLTVIVLTYQSLGNLLGRSSTANSMDYLATYCGAEIKNLDIMLQRNIFKKSYWFGEQTFINLYKWLGPRFGITDTSFALSFLSVNGYNLGNVCTIFYPFIYDFGYEGVAIMIFIMAFICQFIYERIRRAKVINTVDVRIVSFGYIFNAVLFSYFSNKFYEQIFSAVFIYFIIIWKFFKLFFLRIRFRVGTGIREHPNTSVLFNNGRES